MRPELRSDNWTDGLTSRQYFMDSVKTQEAVRDVISIRVSEYLRSVNVKLYEQRTEIKLPFFHVFRKHVDLMLMNFISFD